MTYVVHNTGEEKNVNTVNHSSFSSCMTIKMVDVCYEKGYIRR